MILGKSFNFFGPQCSYQENGNKQYQLHRIILRVRRENACVMLSAVPGHIAAQDSELLVSYCHFCVGVHVLGRGGPALGCRVPPESYVEAITSSGIVLGGGPLGGNQVSMRSGGRGPRDGMGALRRRHARDLAHSLCLCKPGRGCSPGTQQTGTLNLNFQPPEL